MKPVGLLGVQGDYAAHRRVFERLGQETLLVRRPGELDSVSSLVIPGGESTTLLKVAEGAGLLGPLRDFHGEGMPIFGTCAGAILLARKVTGPSQVSLGLIDIEIERNAYGRQTDSFESVEGEFDAGLLGAGEKGLEMVFIRAPRIRSCGPGVEVLARHATEPVLVRQGGVLVSTFHPEMGRDVRVHAYFQGMVQNSRRVRPALT